VAGGRAASRGGSSGRDAVLPTTSVCGRDIVVKADVQTAMQQRESARTCGGQQCGVASDIFMLSDVLLLTFLFPNPSTIASKKRSALHGDDEVGSPAATVYLYGELLLCQIGYKG
jgi:hypothetical protein